MAAVRDLIDPEAIRDLAAQLRSEAEEHRRMWRECNAQASELENQLTADERHVQVKEPVKLADRPKYEALVIQIAYELSTEFLTADVVRAGVPYPTALKWLKIWEERGALESVTVGNRLMWARTNHVPEVVNRRRIETPEARVVRLTPRGGPVEGTGRGGRISHAGVAALVAQCVAKGGQVNQLQNNHYEVRYQGKRIGTIPSTPSDHRSLPNSRAEIRRNGLLV